MVDSAMREAGEAWRRGNSAATVRALEKAVRLRPNFVKALTQLSAVLQYRGDMTQALQVTKKAIAADPKNSEHHISIAVIYELLSDGENAMRAFETASKLNPSDPRGLCGMASVYERMHMLDKAQDAIEAAVETFPDSAVANTIHAKILRRQGEQDRALAILNDVLESAATDDDTYPAAFEKAKLLDKLGKYPEAFEAFTLANKSQARASRMDPIPANPAVSLCQTLRSFTAEHHKQWRYETPLKPMKERVAFLFGFARSGTTMTDRILGAHDQVVVFEELPTIREMHAALHGLDPAGRPIAKLYPDMKPEQVEKLRAAYRQAVMKRLTPEQTKRWKEGELLVLDKYPLELSAIGSIARVLPESKVLVAIRDPRDVCLSCFMQQFSLNISMAQLLTPQSAATYFNHLIGMWLDIRDRLAVDWLEVRYEDTVSDFGAQARRVLEFLELPWDETLGEFHMHTPGTLISTPSYEAVSRPINADAIGRWKKYREQISDTIEQLAPIVERLGYEPA